MARLVVAFALVASLGCSRSATNVAPAEPAPAAPASTATSQPDPIAQAAVPPGDGTGATPAPTEPAPPAGPAAGQMPTGLPAAALTPAQLAQLHPVGPVGGSCSADDACQPPLRCMSGACGWPSAMTGVPDDRTTVATFATASGPVVYSLEPATTNSERARGLMFRRNMAPDAGMLFVFPNERPQSFWMRNTLIPLDMVFVRADLTVDSVVANAEPLTESPRSSDGPALYVIELNAGDAAARGIVAGVTVSLDNAPAAH